MKNPNWVQFANSMNVKGIKVSRIADLPAAMNEFLTYDDGPVLMEAVVDDNEHVYPMVPGVSRHAAHQPQRTHYFPPQLTALHSQLTSLSVYPLLSSMYVIG